jgi:hypothetical protein
MNRLNLFIARPTGNRALTFEKRFQKQIIGMSRESEWILNGRYEQDIGAI